MEKQTKDKVLRHFKIKRSKRWEGARKGEWGEAAQVGKHGLLEDKESYLLWQRLLRDLLRRRLRDGLTPVGIFVLLYIFFPPGHGLGKSNWASGENISVWVELESQAVQKQEGRFIVSKEKGKNTSTLSSSLTHSISTKSPIREVCIVLLPF